jgi:hypothetical protein|tara:strand:+ start:720 stop:1667 length:948 start_codon:yes stop_codon:yes gene_type:complete
MRKNQNFALPTVTSTYAGEFAGKYIAAALLSAKTLENDLITVVPNVKYKEVIQKLDVSGIVHDASCDFTTSGSVALSERVLTPKELQVNLELCKQNFLDSWEALQLGYSAFDEIPANFNDYLISYVGGKVAEATETSIWQGSAAVNGEFRGFLPALSGSAAAGGAGAVVQSAVSGAIDSTNVIAALNGIYEAIPDTVFGKEDLLIYVGTNVAKAYQKVLGTDFANGYNNQVTVGEKPMNFNGIDLAMCPGMTSSYMVAAEKSNLFFGTGLMSDYNEVKVLDMADLDGSQNYRVIMRYTGDTEFGIGQDIAIHIPA